MSSRAPALTYRPILRFLNKYTAAELDCKRFAPTSYINIVISEWNKHLDKTICVRARTRISDEPSLFVSEQLLEKKHVYKYVYD